MDFTFPSTHSGFNGCEPLESQSACHTGCSAWEKTVRLACKNEHRAANGGRNLARMDWEEPWISTAKAKSCTMHPSQEQYRLETNLARIQLCKKRSWGILKGSKLNDSAVLLSCKASQVHVGLCQWEHSNRLWKVIIFPFAQCSWAHIWDTIPSLQLCSKQKACEVSRGPPYRAGAGPGRYEHVQSQTQSDQMIVFFNIENSRLRGEPVAVFFFFF